MEMDDVEKPGNHMTSAAAFVDGGIQEACDDACSICLEEFSENDPAALTTCKHEFHLQCILEWCQRSSRCPMCLQPISLKDPTSQELLQAVEQERNLGAAPLRNTAIFHHPSLGNFELQHLPMGVNEAELEERILQHLAAAAAMGRARHIGRRESQRSHGSANGRPQFLVFSTHPSGPPSRPVSSTGGDNESHGIDPSQQILQFPSLQTAQVSSSASASTVFPANPRQGVLINIRNSMGHSPPPSEDRAGPSDFQSFSESLKSRFNAVSMRYKESISKSTRGWKERLFSRNASMSEVDSEVRRVDNAGISRASHMMGCLEVSENSEAHQSSLTEQGNQNNGENPLNNDGKTAASCASSSAAR